MDESETVERMKRESLRDVVEYEMGETWPACSDGWGFSEAVDRVTDAVVAHISALMAELDFLRNRAPVDL